MVSKVRTLDFLPDIFRTNTNAQVLNATLDQLVQQPNLKQGSFIMFPSYMKHRVTPVTSGTRYSAVTWAYGPSFS